MNIWARENELSNSSSASLILSTSHKNFKTISLGWSFSKSSLSMKNAHNVGDKFKEILKRNELELCQRIKCVKFVFYLSIKNCVDEKKIGKKEVVKFVE